MKRVPIRNEESPGPNKARLFDAIVDGDQITLEFKNGKNCELVALEVIQRQIRSIRETQ